MFEDNTNDLIPPIIRQKLSKIKPHKEKKENKKNFLDELLNKKFLNNYFNKNTK